ncbi:MAG TPA: DM13 domain-containing protein [Candidatus Paceibacterota bacterium]|nr:DM13 domain-containing protein [Candidatus Paceibacterota bacterium]
MKKMYWGIGLIGAAAALAFGWYAVSPLFNPLKTDEALPESAAPMMAETREMAGTIVGTPGHPSSGTVRIVSADGKQYVRYENLKTINGPDIYVYLSKDLGAREYVELGKVKSTEGNANYEIPAGVDPADYRYVLIWCKQFGVLFNSAEINPA